jgi:hypothetical protein
VDTRRKRFHGVENKQGKAGGFNTRTRKREKKSNNLVLGAVFYLYIPNFFFGIKGTQKGTKSKGGKERLEKRDSKKKKKEKEKKKRKEKKRGPGGQQKKSRFAVGRVIRRRRRRRGLVDLVPDILQPRSDASQVPFVA